MATHPSLFDSFELRTSTDPARRDLELVHTECGTVLCDVEHGDSLALLVSIADGHFCP